MANQISKPQELRELLVRHGVLLDWQTLTVGHEAGSNTWSIDSGIYSHRGTRFQGEVTIRPANAASMLFELPIALQPANTDGIASELRQAFAERGIIFSPRVRIAAVEAGNEWLIDDGSFEYTFKKEDGKFTVGTGGFWGWVRANLTPLKGESVWVNKERTQVLLGQRIMHVGENVAWSDAPVFKPLNNNRYYSLKSSPDTLEDWAFHLSWLKDAFGIIVDGINIGISIDKGTIAESVTSTSLNAGRLLAEVIVKLAQHMPMKDLIGSPWVYDLLVDLGLYSVKGIEALIKALTAPDEAPGPEESADVKFSKLVDTVLGLAGGVDLVSTKWTDLILDLLMSIVMLSNHVEPADASKERPKNYTEVGGFVDPFWHLGLIVYTALIPKEAHALPFQSASFTLGYWLGGALGLGAVMGFIGLLIGQSAVAGVNITADGGQVWKTLLKAGGKSTLYFYGYFKLMKDIE
ncbi:MAG: hypothetical protein IPK19_10870 [Chloroflexi bacterium]|nr:hypothetical protein [Chloroflexota bacterium]